jgi:RNA polymerase sigma-70 factor (ECF subfamily)
VVRGQGDFTVAISIADFNGMVADHGPAMYRLAYRLLGDRHEAEDIVQETFRSAWKSRNLFREDGGTRAWLASILRRRVFDHYRQPRPPALLANDEHLETGLPAADPFRDELTDEMQNALSRLPAELKETLILVIVAELTHQQAAEMLGVPLGTVLSRVSRARVRLREILAPPPSGDSLERTRNNINTTK